MPDASNIHELARACGIQTSYIDNTGREQFTSVETLERILGILGVAAGGEREAADALRRLELERAQRVAEPVAVRWRGRGATVPLKVRLPAKEKRFRATIQSNDREITLTARDAAAVGEHRVDGTRWVEYDLQLPDLADGYHTIEIESASKSSNTLLIRGQRKLYTIPGRQWGAFIPLHAAHSEESWGSGNYSDWKKLAEWLGSRGAEVIGALPLLAAFLDYPVSEPSPYSPATRLFWNEFFIDITAIPEFQTSKEAQRLARSGPFQRKIEKFRSSDFADYAAEWEVRSRILRILSGEFFSGQNPRRAEFESYGEKRPEAVAWAKFRAACEHYKKSWHTWPARAKKGALRKSDYSEEAFQFYLYAQWIAQEQIGSALETCRNSGVKFYLDLPLGVNPDGFDAWRYPEFFAPKTSAGAPPDSFFTKGQDWGFAPLHPERSREQHYRYVIDYLRFQMEHTGLLRIDHVMGLHRLWWVPHGFPASEGAYVRYPAEELYGILSVESHRHKTMLVGENLGTVPPEVNKSMARHGLRRMYVLQYEQPAQGPIRQPDADEVASLNTHDMPAFAAHLKGSDIDDRVDLGLIPKENTANEKRARADLRKNLVAFLQKEKLLSKNDTSAKKVLAAALQFLGRSPADTVLATLEDLWLEERSQNVPGTSWERPNWRRKSKLTVEAVMKDRGVAEILAALKEARTKLGSIPAKSRRVSGAHGK